MALFTHSKCKDPRICNMPFYNQLREFRHTRRDGFASAIMENPRYSRNLRTVPPAVVRRAVNDGEFYDHSLRRYPAHHIGDECRGLCIPQIGWYERFLPDATKQRIAAAVRTQSERASRLSSGLSSRNLDESSTGGKRAASTSTSAAVPPPPPVQRAKKRSRKWNPNF